MLSRLLDRPRTQRHYLPVVAVVALAITAALVAVHRQTVGTLDITTPDRVSTAGTSGPLPHALPLSFEPNAGQTDPSVRFMAHTGAGTLFFNSSSIVIA